MFYQAWRKSWFMGSFAWVDSLEVRSYLTEHWCLVSRVGKWRWIISTWWAFHSAAFSLFSVSVLISVSVLKFRCAVIVVFSFQNVDRWQVTCWKSKIFLQNGFSWWFNSKQFEDFKENWEHLNGFDTWSTGVLCYLTWRIASLVEPAVSTILVFPQ